MNHSGLPGGALLMELCGLVSLHTKSLNTAHVITPPPWRLRHAGMSSCSERASECAPPSAPDAGGMLHNMLHNLIWFGNYELGQ